MKKKDLLKKLALMGITGGLVLASQSTLNAHEEVSDEGGTLLAGGGCGGQGGCGGYQHHPGRYQGTYYPAGAPHSCGGASNWGYQAPSHGCGGAHQGWGYQQPPAPHGHYYPHGYISESETPIPPHDQQGTSPYSNQPQQYNQYNQQRNQNAKSFMNQQDQSAGTDSDTTYQNGKTLSESDLMSQLNEQGKAIYRGLDAEGKALALKLANAACKGKNDCKGLGSCKTAEHDCAGYNGCKGQSQCKFKDKNTAVKVAAQKMAQKRSFMNSGSRW